MCSLDCRDNGALSGLLAKLNGKVAAITGATAGLALASAALFVSEAVRAGHGHLDIIFASASASTGTVEEP